MPSPLPPCPDNLIKSVCEVAGLSYRDNNFVFRSYNIETPRGKKWIMYKFYNFCYWMSKNNWDYQEALAEYRRNTFVKYLPQREGFSSYSAMMKDIEEKKHEI
jgi:hypothetical protein